VANPDFLYSTFDNALTDHKYEIGNEMTVTDFMSSWTLQSGYPLLNIQKNETSNTFSVVQVIKRNLSYCNLNKQLVLYQ